jgi:hypothetical protein
MVLKQVLQFSLTTSVAWGISNELKPFSIDQLSKAAFWLTKNRVLRRISINNQIDCLILNRSLIEARRANTKIKRLGSYWSISKLARLLATLRSYPEFEPLTQIESNRLFENEVTKDVNFLLKHREIERFIHLTLDVNPRVRPSKAAKKISKAVIDLATNPVLKNYAARGLIEFAFCTVTRFRGNIVTHYLRSNQDIGNIPFQYVVVPEISVVHGATHQLLKQSILPPNWLSRPLDQSSRSRSGELIEQP